LRLPVIPFIIFISLLLSIFLLSGSRSCELKSSLCCTEVRYVFETSSPTRSQIDSLTEVSVRLLRVCVSELANARTPHHSQSKDCVQWPTADSRFGSLVGWGLPVTLASRHHSSGAAKVTWDTVADKPLYEITCFPFEIRYSDPLFHWRKIGPSKKMLEN